jgi:hypothetical protein
MAVNMFSLNVFGTVIVVLNSVDDAINLFEKRSCIYSDRSCPPMLGDPTLYAPHLLLLFTD